MRDLEVVQYGQTINGADTYFVKCGCKTFVFANTLELITFLTEYIQNPNEYEKRWYEKNEKHGGEVGLAMQTEPVEAPRNGLSDRLRR